MSTTPFKTHTPDEEPISYDMAADALMGLQAHWPAIAQTNNNSMRFDILEKFLKQQRNKEAAQ